MLSHSVLNPRSPLGLAISHLFVAVLIIAGAIVLGIMLVLAYTMVRYRARPGHEGDPPQTYGRTSFEIAWTVIPLLLVITLFGASIATMRLSAPGGDPPPDLTVIGHQWWWEVRYPSGVVTANEVHIPVGKRMYVALKSADVIHSFWVPQLGPKMDLVPGQTNYMWLESSQLGTFEGQCAEFCGAGHAWMLIRVIVQTQAQFNAWQHRQLRLAAKPKTKEEALGALFFRQLSCESCHAIYGNGSTRASDLQSPVIAPNLTHVGSRQTLAAGRLPNTPATMAEWLHDPQKWKPGVLMPNLRLNPRQLRALTSYLESLK